MDKNKKTELISIGKILSSHGVKGFAKIYLLTDYPERFEELHTVYILKEGKPPIESEIEEIRYTNDTLLIKLKYFTSPELVNTFKGALIQIPEDERLELPEEVFYIDQLKGCKVYSEDQKLLGEVSDILEGQNTVLEITTLDKKEVMVPFVKDLVPFVNIAERKLTVKLIPGLFDDNFAEED